MKVIPTTEARKRLSELVNKVSYTNKPVAIGRRDRAEVLLIKFPDQANDQLDDMTNINQFGGSFDFLKDEPDLYTREDITKPYV